jgi:ribosomal protein L37AE/L43A
MEQEIKKNAISFDIDFENIKQDTITTKKSKRIKDPIQAEVIPNVEDPNEANKEQVLYQCPNCGRKFKREAYAKHVPICARVFQGKKEIENPKVNEIKEKLEKPNTKTTKGFGNKSKWENQSNELRAIIQSKRAEKNNNKEIKIEIEEPKKHIDNVAKNASPSKNSRPMYSRDSNGFILCELCNKKFTQIKYESHLNDCKQKYKDKKNGTFHRGNITASGINNNTNTNNPSVRKPTMPAVTYGSNKPKFTVKFGKH